MNTQAAKTLTELLGQNPNSFHLFLREQEKAAKREDKRVERAIKNARIGRLVKLIKRDKAKRKDID